jgi:aldose 1-epimerase
MPIDRARRSYRIGLIPVLCALCTATAATTPREMPGVEPAAQKGSGVTRSTFGKTPDGMTVDLFTLTNAHGVEVRAITYGGIIVSIRVPDKRGQLDDVVLGFDDFAGYLSGKSPYFGALVGRYANRIGGGQFLLDGRTYRLAINNGPNHLHGGLKGFDKVVWSAAEQSGTDGRGIVLSHTSPDGDEGYPGTLAMKVTYTLTESDELRIDYHATTDKATPINLTNHSYFNLHGAGTGDILGHQLMLDADRYTPIDTGLIPTGALASVDGTPLDFRKPTTIGQRIDADDEQIRNGKGYDHNYVINRKSPGLVQFARVVEPQTGRTLEVSTTEPGVQFYSGNFLDGTITGKKGRVYSRRGGFSLETQHFPDSPNKSQFPSTILRPGEEYRSQTVYRFGVQK